MKITWSRKSRGTVPLRSEHKEFKNVISCTKIKAKYTFKDKARAKNNVSDCMKGEMSYERWMAVGEVLKWSIEIKRTNFFMFPGQLSEVLASPALGRSHSRSGYLYCIASVLINVECQWDGIYRLIVPLEKYLQMREWGTVTEKCMDRIWYYIYRNYQVSHVDSTYFICAQH